MKPSQVLSYFFRLGWTGFGGPLAVIAQIQRDLVDKKKIIDADEFRKALALIKSLPGPVAPQMVAYSGQRLGGRWIGLASVILFVLPAFIFMLALAIYYEQFRTTPSLVILMDGMQGGAFLLIAIAMHTLSKGNYHHVKFWFLFALSLILVRFLSLAEPVVICGAGIISVFWPGRLKVTQIRSMVGVELVWACLKAGGLAFGTGLAILPLLQKDFVQVHQWVSKDQFMDALAFAQLTPGPVSVVVTFVGYRIAGFWGAVVATIAIFFPGTFNMLTWFPKAYGWFSRQIWVSNFVIGATAAIVAGILLALISLSESIPAKTLVMPIFLSLLGFKRAIPSWALVVFSGLGWFLIEKLF